MNATNRPTTGSSVSGNPSEIDANHAFGSASHGMTSAKYVADVILRKSRLRQKRKSAFEVKFSTLFDVLAECGNCRHLPSRTERLLSNVTGSCGHVLRDLFRQSLQHKFVAPDDWPLLIVAMFSIVLAGTLRAIA